MSRTGSARRVVPILVVAALAACIAAPTAAATPKPYRALSVHRLAPGIVHEEGLIVTRMGGRQVVHVARVDVARRDVHLRSLLSGGEVVGLAIPTDIATDHATGRATPMVVTNGDVSVLGRSGAQAAPHSLHVSGGEVMVSQECAKPTLGFDADGRARAGLVRLRMRVDLGALRRHQPRNGHRRYLRVAAINTERNADEIVLYTPRFGPSTLTKPGGVEVVLEAAGRIRPSGAVRATVARIRHWGGDAPLKPGQMVLAGHGVALERLTRGDRVTLRSQVMRADPARPCGRGAVITRAFDAVTEAVGGNHWLTHGGRLAAPDPEDYRLSGLRAPRTSIGLTATGRVVMVTVDGRQPGYSTGVTLGEMARLMRSLGAVDSVNLDGGGSTVMAIRMPGTSRLRVVNRPCSGLRQRAVAQALVAFRVSAG